MFTKLQTENWKILLERNLERVDENLIRHIDFRHENLQDQVTGTQWTLISIDRLITNLNKYAPLRGSSYIDLTEVGLDRTLTEVGFDRTLTEVGFDRTLPKVGFDRSLTEVGFDWILTEVGFDRSLTEVGFD